MHFARSPVPNQAQARPGKDVTKHMFSQFAKKAKTHKQKKNSGAPVWHGPIFAPLFRRFSATHCAAIVHSPLFFGKWVQTVACKTRASSSWAHWNFWQLLIFTARRLVMYAGGRGCGVEIAVGPLPKNKNNMMTKSVEFNRSKPGAGQKMSKITKKNSTNESS